MIKITSTLTYGGSFARYTNIPIVYGKAHYFALYCVEDPLPIPKTMSLSKGLYVAKDIPLEN